MNSVQLTKIINKNKILVNCIKGVFSRNKLPNELNYGGYIMNSDNSDKTGSHWIAIYVNENNVAEFLDSFGKKSEFYGISIFPSIFNPICIQSKSSNLCGYFAIFFIYFRSIGMQMNEIINVFEKNHLNKNDEIVNEFISNL